MGFWQMKQNGKLMHWKQSTKVKRSKIEMRPKLQAININELK